MGRSWRGHFLSRSLKFSHASYRDSPSHSVNVVISILSLMVLVGGKYFAKNFWTNSLHVVIVPKVRKFSHILALFFKENENNLRWIASFIMPIYLNVSMMCQLRTSCENSLNWTVFWIIYMISGLISKWIA